MKKTILTAAALLILSGCATKWDVDIAKQNTSRVNVHSEQQANQVKYRSDAAKSIASSYKCSETGSPDCAAAQAMMRYRGFESLERINTVEYGGPSDKTGLDVYHKLADKSDGILRQADNIVDLLLGDDDTPDNVEISGDGNTLHIEENHATAIKESSASLDKSTNEMAAEETVSE